MSVIYPSLEFGNFKLGLGFGARFIYEKTGVDVGEDFYKDPDYRISATMAIDRAIYEMYGQIGIGYKTPFPRPSVEPFGHRFMPAMYGCVCDFAKDAEPWARMLGMTEDDILALEDWTLEKAEKKEPFKETVSQAKYLHKKYGYFSSLPNLGSVINTAIELMGDELLLRYMTNPALVRRLYGNISQLTLICLDFFQKLDGKTVEVSGVGNCTVAMISPDNYMECNYGFDREIMLYCKNKGIVFCVHQDSNVTPHLQNYVKLEYTSRWDFGMDTDFEKLANLSPHSSVNCIWPPQWIMSHSDDELKEEVLRLMSIGKKFKAFSFSCYEIDQFIAERVKVFHDIVKNAAMSIYSRGEKGFS